MCRGQSSPKPVSSVSFEEMYADGDEQRRWVIELQIFNKYTFFLS